MMHHRRLVAAVVALVAVAVTAGAWPRPASSRDGGRADHEVWLVDQSNTSGTTFGGTLSIYDGQALQRDAATAPAERIDLGAATTDLCVAETGAPPVRPHMIAFDRRHTHAVLTFVVSGHVVFYDAASRLPLSCFRTEPGAGGARQAHAAWPTPDGRYVLVANQNGKKLERIATDYRTNTFSQQPEATLDLAIGSTPNGLPRQDPLLRPDNAPICPFVPDRGYPAFISLRGGGLFTVDPYTTPMTIVGEYAADVVPRDGCGFIEAGGWVYASTGGGNPANLDGWFIYRLPTGNRRLYDPSNPPGVPAIDPIAGDDSEHRDAHGVATTRDDTYVWFFDRAANLVEIYRARNGRHVTTVDLTSDLSADPTPDLAGSSPDGRFLYLSLRGPNPLSGDPHASTGSTPGLLVVEVRSGGRSGVVRGLAAVTNVDPAGVERADAHGIAVRQTGGPRR